MFVISGYVHSIDSNSGSNELAVFQHYSEGLFYFFYITCIIKLYFEKFKFKKGVSQKLYQNTKTHTVSYPLKYLPVKHSQLEQIKRVNLFFSCMFHSHVLCSDPLGISARLFWRGEHRDLSQVTLC